MPEPDENKENDMNRLVHLVCTVCAEEFLVTIEMYRYHSGVVWCPCCGSTDLVLLGEREAPGRRVDGAAA